jgi:hypothetical protein
MMNTRSLEESYPQRRNVRMHDHDYTHYGAYFVTICAHDKKSLFGNLIDNTAPTKIHPLSEIVRAFKSYSSQKINKHRHSRGTPVWQRSYYEHVIRSEDEFTRIGEYILFNATKWETDRENPFALIIAPALPFEH